MFASVKGAIADKMIIDSRDKKQEESKEKPDVSNRYTKISKGQLEDVKEEASDNNTESYPKQETPVIQS